MQKYIKDSIKNFFCWPASTGLILLFSALLALFLANSTYSNFYHKILHYPLGLSLGQLTFSFSLHHLVNEGLMTIFFFVVGLEIKKELVVGELSTFKKAILPVFAALGGMLVPAFFYLVFNMEGPTQKGWGIPMATDIAFAVGVLSLISKRVPPSLKVFLLALAIVDDLGAVLVIAFFYSKKLSLLFLILTGFFGFVLFYFLKLGWKNQIFYIIGGLVLWLCVLKSGVHATVAGVILGLICPAKQSLPKEAKGSPVTSVEALPSSYKQAKKRADDIRQLYSPAHRWIEDLHPFVNLLIMPLFAFFNAGVKMGAGFSFMEFLSHPVSVGVFLGLFLGKPLGVLMFSFVALRLNWAVWPSGFNWGRLTGVGFLAGIGFTMALFIAHLSFDSQVDLNMYAKLSILLASLLAMLLGLSFLLFSAHNKN